MSIEIDSRSERADRRSAPEEQVEQIYRTLAIDSVEDYFDADTDYVHSVATVEIQTELYDASQRRYIQTENNKQIFTVVLVNKKLCLDFVTNFDKLVDEAEEDNLDALKTASINIGRDWIPCLIVGRDSDGTDFQVATRDGRIRDSIPLRKLRFDRLTNYDSDRTWDSQYEGRPKLRAPGSRSREDL